MDLMEFSMTEGNDTLTGDENFLPPKLMQTPVVVNSILKPSTKGNLMQLHTPKPQQKNLKVKFETPRSVKEVTPTRYEQIADLDEKENWIERTAIVTKTDHLLNIECAKSIVSNIVENLPLSESESVNGWNKPTVESEEEEEAFFDASEETDKITSDTPRHPTPTPTPVDTLPAPQETTGAFSVPAEQQVNDAVPVSAPQGATGVLEVSMECAEADVLATEEPMDCDETAMEIDITVINNKTLIEDKVTSPKTALEHPVTVVTSPPLPASSGAYSIDFDNLDSFNPFQTKNGINNSPVLNTGMHNKPAAGEKIDTEQAPLNTDIVENVSDSQASEGVLGIEAEVSTDLLSEVLPDVDGDQVQGIYNVNFDDKSDPFATKSQIQNSPIAADPLTTKSQVQNSPLPADPFATKSQVQNSPLPADPFATKSQVQNSPLPAEALVTKLQAHDNDMSTDIATEHETQLPVNGGIKTPQRPMKVDEADPFSTKSKVVNSPLQASVLHNSNPFATKSNVCNSPIHPANEKMILTEPTVHDSLALNSSDPVASLTHDESAITPKKTLVIEEDTLSVMSKKANSPPGENQEPTTETALVLEDNPFTTKSKVPNSPTPSAAVNMDALADLDPFTTKSKVTNSPVTSTISSEDPSIDPFTTKSKVPNSPISGETGKKDPMEDLDPFTTKSKVPDSPPSSVASAEDPSMDPFTTKSKVPNSPPSSLASTEVPLIDPFTTKSKVPNSPISSEIVKKDPMEDLDPFTTKSKVPNSPSPSVASTEVPLIDPFTTKSKVPNSPISSEVKKDPIEERDPFTTTSKVPNSPISSEVKKDTIEERDPFTTKSKVPNSPPTSVTSAEDISTDPFTTKSKVPNSPPLLKTSTTDPLKDPFATKSKAANSPTSSATMKKDPLADLDPFTTKSKVPNSPSPPAPKPEMTTQTTQQVKPPQSSENKLSEEAFQNIQSRNTLPESASGVPDFSDEEFRPATDCLFNDSSFLDVLEKFGSSSSSENKISDLARMSLYVKFDPLVDFPASDPRRASMNLLKRASIMNMPRKSLSGKSLSEVCNAEESMLLMGTPPKQMSRLASVASRTHHTGFTPGSTPTTPKAFKPQLDLLCANTPPRSVKKSTTPAPVKVNSNIPEEPADNLAAGSDDNIIEVLQYTDKDMCEMKSSLFLEFQGQKLLLEREWTKVVDKLKAKIEEQNKTLEKKQADIELMGNISKELEIVVEGLIQEKEKEKDVTAELKKEREQAVQDTQSLEKAFSELHRRNEKLKEILSGHVKNQEILTAHAKELQKSLTAVKTESKQKIVELTQQLSKVKSDLNQITTSSEARAKRDKLQIESLQKTVDQKMSENKELTQMCDELLAKVSK